MNKINPLKKSTLINEYWSPKILGELNDQYIKIAKFKGEFVRHNHKNEDELFIAVSGSFKMILDDKEILINEGEMIIIPKGVYHKPVAEKECTVLLIEPKSTINTGDENSNLKREKLEWV